MPGLNRVQEEEGHEQEWGYDQHYWCEEEGWNEYEGDVLGLMRGKGKLLTLT